MKTIRKLLYLLQLEEYQTDRYLSWLKKNNIGKLIENKGKLKYTLRIRLTLAIALLTFPFVGAKRSVMLANILVSVPFKIASEALYLLAMTKMHFYPNLTKIVVTGSYGKTTFKEMLSFVLETKYSVLKTVENKNTPVGISLLILKSLKKNIQVLIVEAGAYEAGEIRKICNLVKPDMGVVTVVGLMHLERFKTQENIKKAKYEIVPFISNRQNLYLPLKDDQFLNFPEVVLSISKKLDVPTRLTRQRLGKFRLPDHRLEERKINDNLTILDDSYNSNPLGFEKALKKLSQYKRSQKIIVTPGMIELGDKQAQLNQELGQKAAVVGDILVVVGKTNRKALLSGIKRAKKSKTQIVVLEKDETWSERIATLLRPPVVVLLENDLPDHYF